MCIIVNFLQQIIGLLSYGYDNPGIPMESLVKNVSVNSNPGNKTRDKFKSPRSRSHRPIPHRVILLMTQMGNYVFFSPFHNSKVCISFKLVYVDLREYLSKNTSCRKEQLEFD